MSKYSETSTTVHNQSYLVAALSELGYKAEIHADGAALIGYGKMQPGGIGYGKPTAEIRSHQQNDAINPCRWPFQAAGRTERIRG